MYSLLEIAKVVATILYNKIKSFTREYTKSLLRFVCCLTRILSFIFIKEIIKQFKKKKNGIKHGFKRFKHDSHGTPIKINFQN